MQTSLIVSGARPTDCSELNQFLKEGWRVVSTCPMPSSCAMAAVGHYGGNTKEFGPQCLVILEK